MITIDGRPGNSVVMLVDDSVWKICSAVRLLGQGNPEVRINPSMGYAQFIDTLYFLKNQTLTKTLVLTNQTVLDALPFVALAYQNSDVPEGMHFTLVASVNGYNGNASVNKVTFTDSMLKTLGASAFESADSTTLTISF
jgi:hypothetical protein